MTRKETTEQAHTRRVMRDEQLRNAACDGNYPPEQEAIDRFNWLLDHGKGE